jgi:hypothetical protein
MPRARLRVPRAACPNFAECSSCQSPELRSFLLIHEGQRKLATLKAKRDVGRVGPPTESFDDAVFLVIALARRGRKKEAWEAVPGAIAWWWPVEYTQMAPSRPRFGRVSRGAISRRQRPRCVADDYRGRSRRFFRRSRKQCEARMLFVPSITIGWALWRDDDERLRRVCRCDCRARTRRMHGVDGADPQPGRIFEWNVGDVGGHFRYLRRNLGRHLRFDPTDRDAGYVRRGPHPDKQGVHGHELRMQGGSVLRPGVRERRQLQPRLPQGKPLRGLLQRSWLHAHLRVGRELLLRLLRRRLHAHMPAKHVVLDRLLRKRLHLLRRRLLALALSANVRETEPAPKFSVEDERSSSREFINQLSPCIPPNDGSDGESGGQVASESEEVEHGASRNPIGSRWHF